MSQLTWTDTTPTVEGWFWVKANTLTPRVVKIHDCHGQGFMTCDYGIVMYLGNEYGQPALFAGPIQMPEVTP